GRDRGFTPKVRQGINLAVGRSYREAIREFAAMRNLDLWYARLDIEDLVQQFKNQATDVQRKRVEKNLERARAKDSMKACRRLPRVVAGRSKIVGDPPLIVPLDELVEPGQAPAIHKALAGIIRSYRRTLSGDRRRLLERFRYVDAARKVVGVGSVG